ncbi:MAG: glycerophosphodiester phosphodiesterase [Chitinophagaceae bacterium]|nr:MAG: glycerophosphodiester phosphodiesterase [Chitinophagaceae bacterium]
MMKSLLFTVLMLIVSVIQGQVLIHSHNDYEGSEPLFNALRYEAFTVEADVYLVNGKLAVAHDRKDIDTSRTLSSLYLDPLDSLFKLYKGRVSANKNYRPTLAIDIKSDGPAVLSEIARLVKTKPEVFDRRKNKNAIQIIVSGDRGPIEQWTKYPPFIMFDGRPLEHYNEKTLEKVLTISDSYGRYARNNQLDTAALIKMIKTAHDHNKLVRLWGAPDEPQTWILFRRLGVDIINTDKIAECRAFLADKSNQ